MPIIEHNFSPKQLQLIKSAEPSTYVFKSDERDYIRISVFDEDGEFIEYLYARGALDSLEDVDNDFYYSVEDDGRVFVKPNDILESRGYQGGNYTLRFDFLNDYGLLYDGESSFFSYSDDQSVSLFNVKEISPSRKEVRLFFRDQENELLNLDDNDYGFSEGYFKSVVGDSTILDEDQNPYRYDWILGLSEGRNISIVNYVFDRISNPNNPTLILRLNESIPTDVIALGLVQISQEVLQTQIEDIYLVPDEVVVTRINYGLDRDQASGGPSGGGTTDIEYNQFSSDDTVFQNYDQLSGSLVDASLINMITSGSDINLNVDYSNMKNHAFFGSVSSKLDNFKYKVGKIENYLADISSSLTLYTNPATSSVVSRRKGLFGKINDIIKTFTPYERFLYYDNQSYSTASAPGLGVNLSDISPINESIQADGSPAENVSTLTNFNGFNTVHKVTNKNIDSGDKISLFDGKYFAQGKPFFNYSGSVYLSFLLRAPEEVTGSIALSPPPDGVTNSTKAFYWANTNTTTADPKIPVNALDTGSILNQGVVSGSEYRRFILVASQSYWRPRDGKSAGGITDGFSETDSSTYEILSSSEHIQSASNVPRNNSAAYLWTVYGKYANLASALPSSGSDFTDITTGTGFALTGSILPSSELFNISWRNSFGAGFTVATQPITSSYFTDVRISTKDPSDCYPFTPMYKTVSSVWDTWYSNLYDSSSVYDENNVHSLWNNLPRLVREDPEAGDLKLFVNMVGEHFDLIRNYIDNYLNINKRNYKDRESVPKNLMPIIAQNLGWELLNPFSGSLSQYFGGTEGQTFGDSITVESVTHNTWRKILNNLVYVYKTKGTQASIRALLNIYGYPPDLLNVQEFGGSTEEHNPEIIKNDVSDLKAGLAGTVGNISFRHFKDQLYSYMFGSPYKTLNFEWGANSVSTPDTIEFIIKPHKSAFTQSLVENSGSGTQLLWDLRLIPSSSRATSGKIEFRLNNSNTGSSAIVSNAVSMSTDYLNIKTGGDLWNVLLQRATSSISGTGVQEYRLYVGYQELDKITVFNAISMSVSGGLVNSYVTGGADTNFYANQNWFSTGSRHFESGSNLVVGKTYSGSMAEFRTWSIPLSASKFKQHILNKKSTVGHQFSSSMDDVYYRYSLGENWKSGSINPKIKDLNPNNVKDYSISLNTDIFTGSGVLYDRTDIDTYKLSTRYGGSEQINDNKIVINPSVKITGDLSPTRYNVESLYLSDRENKRRASTKLQIVRSPQTVINDFILDNLSDLNISKFFADPSDLYESHYEDLNEFRDKLFEHFNFSFDINKWIDSQSSILSPFITQGMKSLIPARSTADNIGVLFEPNILERNKIESKAASISHKATIDSDMDHMSYIKLTPIFEASKNATHEVVNEILSQSGDYNSSFSAEPVSVPISTGSYSRVRSTELYPIPIFTGSRSTINSGELGVLPSYTLSYLESKNSELTLFTHDREQVITDVGSNQASFTFSFTGKATDSANITLISTDGRKRKYAALSTGSANNGDTSGSLASTTFTFSTTAVDSAQIELVSTDETRKVYSALSSSTNGAFSADSSSVLYSTGSTATIAASNLLAAITSSNGHTDKFVVKQISGKVELTQSIAGGILGNTLIGVGTGSLPNTTFEGITDPSPIGSFSGGSDDDIRVIYSTGSSAATAAQNFLAAVTSSLAHKTRFSVSREGGKVELTQADPGFDGNTSVTITNNFTASSAERDAPASASFTFITSSAESSNILLSSIDGTTRTYTARSSSVNGTTSGGNILYATGSASASAASNFLAAVTSSEGHNTKFIVKQIGGSVELTQSVYGLTGNTTITTTGGFTDNTSPNPLATFQGGLDFPDFTGGKDALFRLQFKDPSIIQMTGQKESPVAEMLFDEFVGSTGSYDQIKNVSLGGSPTPSVEYTEYKKVNILTYPTSSAIYSKYQKVGIISYPTSSVKYLPIKSSEITKLVTPFYTSSYSRTKDSEITLVTYDRDRQDLSLIKTVAQKESPVAEMLFDDFVSSTGSHNPVHEKEITDMYNLTSSNITVHELEIEKDEIYQMTSSYQTIYEGVDPYASSQSIAEYKDYSKLWGTGSDSTHFINKSFSGSGNVETDRWQNVGHFEYDFVFKTIGDLEVMSGSTNENATGFYIDFQNPKVFYNRELRDKGTGHVYDSFIKVGSGDSGDPADLGPQDGRPVGKTWYYATSSTGELNYPVNHWTRFGEDPFRISLANGSQWDASPRKYHTRTIEDVTESAAYTTTVADANEIVIRRGITSMNKSKKIIR